jgi:hypothetical protein
MVDIGQEQLNQRYEILPDELKEALFSATVAEIIWHLGQSYRLNEEKINILAADVGYVLLGLLNYKDLASEIQKDLGIDSRLALAISNDLWSRIFAQLKDKIDKIYSPISPVEKIEEKTVISPPPIDLRQKEEVKPNIPTAPTPPTITPKPLSQPPIPSSIPTSSSTTMPSGPAILFKPETASLKTPSQKSSLGGLFGLFSKKERKTEKEKVKAQIEAPTIKPTQEQKSAKTEAPTFKVVHYSQFEPKTAPTQEQSKEEPKIIFGKSEAPLSSITVPKKDSLTTLSVMPETTKKSSTVPQPPSPPMPPSHLSKMEELPQPSTLPPQLPQQVDEKPKIESAFKEKEMVDLETLQKVKIQAEEEQKPKNDIIDLRKK